MSRNKTYPEQVADLIEMAFRGAPEMDAGAYAVTVPLLRVHAAQALATLALVHETRVSNLLAAAAHPPEGANPDLVREAYTAAVTHLALIEPEPEESLADLRAALGVDDPADAKLGDL